ncbi:MAG: hypothetical protein ACFFDW_13525 [Candidatus Thorarchaeota archaeon]
MSERKPKRINQWFVRGIALIVSGLMCTILFLTFTSFDQDQFHSGWGPTEIDFSILAKEIGTNLWTFRVYDMFVILAILLVVIISAYYLVNFQAVKQPPKPEHRGYE